jgi:hypothetical protein
MINEAVCHISLGMAIAAGINGDFVSKVNVYPVMIGAMLQTSLHG